MKVAMVDPSLFTGRYDDSLCAALGAQGHDVALLGRAMRDTDAIVPEGYRFAPRFFRLSEKLRPLLGEGVAFRAIKAAEYLADAMAGPTAMMRDADVVHVQWMPFARADRYWLDRWSRGPGAPALVHTVHNAQAYHGETSMQGRGYRALLDRFDMLIVHGEETRAALMRVGVTADKMAIVPHPPMRLAAADAAMMASVPDPVRTRLLFFGTIRPYKGFDLLIEACISLWRRGAQFELAVAGKPFMPVEPLVAKVRDAGYGDRLVLDLDFLKEERLDAHLRKADMVVFPYRHIDSSGAFLSALHYGKAMICTRIGMFAHLPPESVAVCDAENVAALADAIRPLIEDGKKRTAMGQRAAALGEQLGNWEAAARATVQVYAQATERRVKADLR